MTITVTSDGGLLLDVEEIQGVDELTVRLLEVRAKNANTGLIRGDQTTPTVESPRLAAIRAANLPVSAALNQSQ